MVGRGERFVYRVKRLGDAFEGHRGFEIKVSLDLYEYRWCSFTFILVYHYEAILLRRRLPSPCLFYRQIGVYTFT
jgi:hypothetical protein